MEPMRIAHGTPIAEDHASHSVRACRNAAMADGHGTRIARI
jgi:hypothetical protein